MKGVHVTAMLVIAGSAAAVVAPLRSPEKPSGSQAPPAPFVATVQNENERPADRGPATWPPFTVEPVGIQLSQPGQAMQSMWPPFTVDPEPEYKPAVPIPAKQAIADAENLVRQWDEFKRRKSRQKPTMAESGKVIEQLLAIPETSPDFRAARAAFVRARTVVYEIYRRQKRS